MYALTPRFDSDDSNVQKREPLFSALNERKEMRESRRNLGVIDWRVKLQRELQDDENWVKHIQHWVEYCTGLQVEDVHIEDLVDLFITVQWHRAMELDSDAKEVLAKFQADILVYRKCQTNMVVNYYKEVGFEYESDGESEADLGKEDEDTLDTGSASDRLEKDNCVQNNPKNIQDFMAAQITSRSSVLWSHKLCNSSEVWTSVCKYWVESLTQVLREQDEMVSPGGIINSLRQMKCLKFPKKHAYHEKWRKSVKASGLGDLISRICKPEFILSDLPHTQLLFKKNRIQESLGLILTIWTPNMIVKKWGLDNLEFLPSKVTREKLRPLLIKSGKKQIDPGKLLIDALVFNPNLIPCHSHPQAVFFLLSQGNFIHSWNAWLGPCLEHLGYDVKDVAENPKDYFSAIKNYLICRWKYEGDKFKGIKDASLRKILERTIEVEMLRKAVHKHLFPKESKTRKIQKRKASVGEQSQSFTTVSWPSTCPHCPTRLEGERCVQNIKVSLQDLHEVAKIKGQGISCVPKHFQMIPSPPSDQKEAQAKIYNPDDLPFKLSGYGPSEDVISRCGKQVFHFFNENGELVDVLVYNAFKKEHLERMVNHSKKLSKIKPIKRGGQFQQFSQGQMRGIGSRLPAGGAPGDAYRAYEGTSADSLEDLDLLFNHAEDVTIMFETMRAYHPKLAEEFKQSSENLDRLGRSGCNLYKCFDYTAPQHQDDDACRSLCTQLELISYTPWKEYGFIQASYGYYFESRPNTLWSFDPTLVHGTMLPSPLPLEEIPAALASLEGAASVKDKGKPSPPPSGPIRVSLGVHATARKKDKQRAELYQQGHAQYSARSKYWN